MFDKNKIISRIVNVSFSSKEGHIASSLSILDLLYVLYDKFISNDNYFILSKGHASLGLYSILEQAKKGLGPESGRWQQRQGRGPLPPGTRNSERAKAARLSREGGSPQRPATPPRPSRAHMDLGHID